MNRTEQETIRGLHVKDYKDLDVQALEEIAQLDEQLLGHLRKLMEYVKEQDYRRLDYNLDCLIADTESHKSWTVGCQSEVLCDMYEKSILDCQLQHKRSTKRQDDCKQCTEVICPMSDVNNQ